MGHQDRLAHGLGQGHGQTLVAVIEVVAEFEGPVRIDPGR